MESVQKAGLVGDQMQLGSFKSTLTPISYDVTSFLLSYTFLILLEFKQVVVFFAKEFF